MEKTLNELNWKCLCLNKHYSLTPITSNISLTVPLCHAVWLSLFTKNFEVGCKHTQSTFYKMFAYLDLHCWNWRQYSLRIDARGMRLQKFFLFTDPVVTQWENWGEWSQCSTTCGPGSEFRARWCTKQVPGGNETCTGNATETKACKLEDCPGVSINNSWGTSDGDWWDKEGVQIIKMEI